MALPLLLCAPALAAAQEVTPAAAPGEEERQVDFSADQLTYDTDAEIVTASGAVRMTTEGNNLRADSVIWHRPTGEVRAEGNVRIVNPPGDAAYGARIVLTDTLHAAMVATLISLLEDAGRRAPD